MSGLQEIAADQTTSALLADELLSRKSLTFAHPEEVVNDQELTLADKRSLLASWASDALAVKNSHSLRQLASGAVVCVNDVMAALKTLDLDQSRHDAALTFSHSFPRRHSKPAARRLNLRPDDDNEPPPPVASARVPPVRKILIGGNGGSRTGMGSVANATFRHR